MELRFYHNCINKDYNEYGVPNGWVEIVSNLLNEIHSIEKRYECDGFFHLENAKEKWGKLSIDYSCYFPEIDFLNNPNLDFSCQITLQKIEDAIAEATTKSIRTCHICGQPKKYMSTEPWMLPWCEECAVEYYEKAHLENRTFKDLFKEVPI